MTADLHTHSLHSDGLTTPRENAALAARAGLRAIALTDHDTLDGLEEAEQACAEHGLELIPGIELSAEVDEVSVHVLGYWPDPDHLELRAECRRLRTERDRRAAVMVQRLVEVGFDITLERVRAIAGDAPVGRPHLAAALLEIGAVPDFETAFSDWIGDGGRAYEPKRALHPVAAVRLLRSAGAVPVLAHPGASGRGDGGGVPLELVKEMVAAGLAGVEADTPAHEPLVADRWRIVAQERHLVVTGSSDFHGRADGSQIGERWTRAAALEALASQRGPAPGSVRDGAEGSEDK